MKTMDGKWLFQVANKDVDLTKIDKEYFEKIISCLKLRYKLEVEEDEDIETALKRQKESLGYNSLWHDVWSVGGTGKGDKCFIIGVFAHLSTYNQENTRMFLKTF